MGTRHFKLFSNQTIVECIVQSSSYKALLEQLKITLRYYSSGTKVGLGDDEENAK